MKNNGVFGILIWMILTLWGQPAQAEPTYSHFQISNEMFEPKVWVNEKLHVLWSEGPDYEHLVLFKDGSISTLTENCKAGTAVLNKRGQVAWVEKDNQVYLSRRDKKVRLSDGKVTAWNIDINSRGQVVWDANNDKGRDIYFYNKRKVRQITTSGRNGGPKISDKGHIAWQSIVKDSNDPSDFEILYYHRGRTFQLTDNSFLDDNPKISAKGHVVWSGIENQSVNIFFFDRHQVIQLTDNQFGKTWPTISPKGQAFWLEFLGVGNSELFTYSQKMGLWQVTDNDYEESLPEANDRGHFAWAGMAGSIWPWEIFYYNGHNILRLTDNETFDKNLTLNNRGQVAWTHFAGNYNQSGELHLFDGSTTHQLTKDNPTEIHDTPRMINDKGNIVYTRSRGVGSPGAQEFYVKIFHAIKQ
jgi:hypothetical protein